MSQDRYPPLPPLSPQDRAYAEVVVTQSWTHIPQIQTQEANAARVAALEAEIARLRAGLAALRLPHERFCQSRLQLACTCSAGLHNSTIDALLHGDTCTG